MTIEDATGRYIEAARDFEERLMAALGNLRTIRFHVEPKTHFLKVCFECVGWSSGVYARISKPRGDIRDFVYASSLGWRRVFGNVFTGDFGLPAAIPEPETDLSAIWTAWYLAFDRVPFALSDQFAEMLKKGDVEAAADAIRITAAKSPPIATDDDRVKYIFGVLRQNALKVLSPERAAEQEAIFKLRDYWRRRPRGTGYLNNSVVRGWLKCCTPDEIRVVMNSAEGIWADLCEQMERIVARRSEKVKAES